MPDTSEKQKEKARKVKQQIQWELRSKAKNERRGRKKVITRPGLTEWLVPTILSVSAEELSDGSVRRSP